MPGLNNSEDNNHESSAADLPQDRQNETETAEAAKRTEAQEQPTDAAEDTDDRAEEDVVAQAEPDTQERADAIAAEESESDEAALMADEPAEPSIEGLPDAPADESEGEPSAEEQPTPPAPAEASEEGEGSPPTQAEAAEAEEEADAPQETEGETAEAADETDAQPKKRRRSGYQRGEVIDVTVKEVSPTSVTVELDERGEGFTGLVPSRELDRMSGDMMDMLQPGETVQLYVVNPGDPEGNVILSLNRALEELDWQEAERFHESREIYQGFIGGYNKGGLIVRFGRLRGFIPQSQISDERRARAANGDTPEEKWSGMVREPITVKVIEVDRGRNRLILSERAAMRETREQRKARLIEELTLNEVRTGRVVSLEDFGAFVDIGGAEGLVHLTELSWGHVTHPRQVLEVGDEITVEVISIDPKRKRIGLSLKRQLPDPWDVVASNYRQGELVKAEVTKLTKFGAFAQLADQPEVEGLIHISELSEDRVAHPREVVEVGEELTLRIVKIDVADRRLGLSLKAVNSTEYLDSDMDFLYDEDD